MLRQGSRDEFFRARNSVFESNSGRESGGDGSGKSAAGPVGGDVAHKWRLKIDDVIVHEQEVDRQIAFEMSSFKQNRNPKLFFKLFTRLSHRRKIGDGPSQEFSGFIQVGSDH